MKLLVEFEGLILAASDRGHDLGDRARAEHYVNAEFLAHPAALGQLRETAHQPYGQPPAVLLFSEFAEQRLSLLDGLAAHGARVDEHKVGFAKIVDE